MLYGEQTEGTEARIDTYVPTTKKNKKFNKKIEIGEHNTTQVWSGLQFTASA